MSPELKSLIEASVVNGQVDEQAKKVIHAKAAQQGISEDECAIFISSVIRAHLGQQKAIKAEVNYRAYVLIFSGVVDFLYGTSIADIKLAQDVAAFCMLSGIALSLFGLHLLGKNVRSFLKGAGWFLAICVVVAVPVGKLFGTGSRVNDVEIAVAYPLIFLLTIIFRNKIFGKKYVEKYPSIFGGKFFVIIDNARKKIISNPKVDQFLES
jgi:hypothetical protein